MKTNAFQTGGGSRAILSVAIALSSLTGGAASPQRDWSRFPAIVRIDKAHDLYALGDLHGDYDKTIALLVASGLIRSVPPQPQDVQWNAGKAVLVCTGDLIDKWTQSVEVVQLMRALQASAAASGGRVIVTMGNHEAEFLASGGHNSKGAEFETELAAQHIDPRAVAAGSDSQGIGQWLRDLPIAAKVGDWFFCHAGNTGGKSLDAMEHDIESGVDRDGFGAAVLSQPNSILEARAHPIPWWLEPASGGSDEKHREKSEPTGSDRLRAYAEALGCKHIVMGHQPDKIKFGSKDEREAGEPFAYDGVLFLIDTGMSRGVQNGRGVVLKLHTGSEKESATVINSDGKSAVLWSSK